MIFIEHDQVIQAFSTDGADGSFSVGILPRRSRRCRDFFDSQVFQAFLEMSAIDAVTITHQKTWGLLVGEGVDNLLGRPLCVGIGGDVEMHDLSSIMPQHDENVEYSKRNRRHGKKITGSDIWCVIVEERSPSL